MKNLIDTLKMKTDGIGNKEMWLELKYKSTYDLFESIIQSNAPQLLSEESTNKLNLKEIKSGGISLIIFSFLIMVSANIAKNVKIFFTSIAISCTFKKKEQGIVLPLID